VIHPLDSDRLLAFATVARESGFSRAARVLGKTQSAVSQAVLQLERDVGLPLFVRDGRATRLTDAGRELLDRTERIFSEMEAARQRISALGELSTGRLSIGTSDTLACHLLPPVFRAFRERFPGIELKLENRPSPETARAVLERRVDLGVVVLPFEDAAGAAASRDKVEVVPLVRHVDTVICLPDHPLARRRRVRARDLAAEPLLLLDRTTGTRAHVDAAFERARVRPRVTMEMGSVEVLKRLVELGFGVSIVPGMAVRTEVARGSLAAVGFSGGGRRRSVGIVTPKSAALSPATRAFVATATSTLAEHAEANPSSTESLPAERRRSKS
jgi:DNA-binding transcriptional LysR family regulator